MPKFFDCKTRRILKLIQKTEVSPGDYRLVDDIVWRSQEHSPEQIRASIDYLVDSGYLKYADSSKEHIVITAPGWHSNEYAISSILAYILKSVIVPIAVSAVTAIIITS